MMKRRGGSRVDARRAGKPCACAGDGSVEGFRDDLLTSHELAVSSVALYVADLRAFERYLAASGKTPLSADTTDVNGFIYEPRSGRERSAASAARRLTSLRRYYAYLRRLGLRTDDPSNVKRPRQPRRRVEGLSDPERAWLLNSPDTSTAIGLRDRVMLELACRNGLRASQIVALRRGDVELGAGHLRLRNGRGGPKIVRLDRGALLWLRAYVNGSALSQLGSSKHDVLFPSNRGRQMTRQTFWNIVRRNAKAAGITRALNPRILQMTANALQAGICGADAFKTDVSAQGSTRKS